MVPTLTCGFVRSNFFLAMCSSFRNANLISRRIALRGTSSLPRMTLYQDGAHDRARTGEPLPYQGSALPLSYVGLGAGNGIRTRDIQLGRLTLYHLSYSRPRLHDDGEGMDSNLRRLRRQIYSLLPLAARVPLRTLSFVRFSFVPLSFEASRGRRRGSNPRPTDYKSVALPPELHRHRLISLDFFSYNDCLLPTGGGLRNRPWTVPYMHTYPVGVHPGVARPTANVSTCPGLARAPLCAAPCSAARRGASGALSL